MGFVPILNRFLQIVSLVEPILHPLRQGTRHLKGMETKPVWQVGPSVCNGHRITVSKLPNVKDFVFITEAGELALKPCPEDVITCTTRPTQGHIRAKGDHPKPSIYPTLIEPLHHGSGFDPNVLNLKRGCQSK